MSLMDTLDPRLSHPQRLLKAGQGWEATYALYALGDAALSIPNYYYLLSCCLSHIGWHAHARSIFNSYLYTTQPTKEERLHAYELYKLDCAQGVWDFEHNPASEIINTLSEVLELLEKNEAHEALLRMEVVCMQVVMPGFLIMRARCLRMLGHLEKAHEDLGRETERFRTTEGVQHELSQFPPEFLRTRADISTVK